MNQDSPNNPFHYLNRMERFAVLLTDVRYCFLGKAHRMSRENIMLMLDQIVHDEHIFYMIFFMGAYKAVKKENTDMRQKEEIIDAMKQLMGWEKQNIRNKVTDVYKFNISIDDLIKKEDVGNPKEEFTSLTKLFFKQRKPFTNFVNSRPFYKNILNPPPQATLYVCVLLENVANFFRDKEKQFDWDQMSNMMEDIFDILLEWISIVAGLTYYHLKYDLGTDKQVRDILDALKDINGK